MSHLKIGESRVIESREALDGTVIRRRRVSNDGKYRFTTYERIERPSLMIYKRSGAREAFDRDKMASAIRTSVGKYFSKDSDVEEVIEEVIERIYALNEAEIPSRRIGETIIEVLADVNEMAYVRFVSVFREFKTLDELEGCIKEQRMRMKEKKKKEGKCE